jgi:protease I
VSDRRSSVHPEPAPDVTAVGGRFVDGAAVIDAMLVSGRAWPDRPAWMREFLRVLRAKAPVED